jgi:C1A family cysteine protease
MVDWREYCGPVVAQSSFPTSSAHACVAMVQYFEKRATGKSLQPSRAFVHQNALRLSGVNSKGGVSLRATLKAMIQFGLPPEHFWPYDADHIERVPDGFVYGFNGTLQGCRYLRLDARGQSGPETLEFVQAFVAAGFAVVTGFPLPNSVSDAPDIHFPVRFDSCQTGHAVLIVGYDDKRRIRSDRGALLTQNSWGVEWGERGFGWLPYAYLNEGLAVDFWTLVMPKWIRSAELEQPSFKQQLF